MKIACGVFEDYYDHLVLKRMLLTLLTLDIVDINFIMNVTKNQRLDRGVYEAVQMVIETFEKDKNKKMKVNF